MNNKVRLLAFITVLITTQSANSKEVVTFLFQEQSPFIMEGNWGPYGLIGDVIRALVIKSDVSYQWKSLPLSRQMLMLKKKQKNVCIAGATRNQDLNETGVFSRIIFRKKGYVVFSRKGDEFFSRGNSLVDILTNKEKKLLIIKGGNYKYSVGEFIDKYKPSVIELTSDIHNAFKMLYSGRSDYVIMTEDEGNYLIFLAKLKLEYFQRTRPNGLPPGEEYYFWCSGRTAPEVIKKLDLAIDDILNKEKFE